MADSSPLRTHNADDTTLRFDDDPRLSPVEAQILTEYARLKANLDSVSRTKSAMVGSSRAFARCPNLPASCQ